MASEEKENKAKIIVLSILLAIVVVFIIVFAIIQIVNLKKNEKVETKPQNQEEEIFIPPYEPENTEPDKEVPNAFSNTYNEAITRHILSDDGYSYKGTYTFEKVSTLYFNEYSENNTKGFKEEEIQQFLQENECNNRNDFKLKINSEKNSELNGDLLTIDNPIDANTGTNLPYGIYSYSNNSNVYSGKVYGDSNLAMLVKDGSDEQNYTFISLNYKNISNAILVNENVEKKEQTLYLFENYYKDGRILYTLTLIYKVV